MRTIDQSAHDGSHNRLIAGASAESLPCFLKTSRRDIDLVAFAQRHTRKHHAKQRPGVAPESREDEKHLFPELRAGTAAERCGDLFEIDGRGFRGLPI